MLLARSALSVAEVVRQSYDQLWKQRALSGRPYQRDESVAGLEAVLDQSSLFAHIETFVREEVARQLSVVSTIIQHPDPPPPSPQQQPTYLASILHPLIQEQIADALAMPVQQQLSPCP